MTLVGNLAIVAALLCAFTGWGWAARRLLALPSQSWCFDAVLGLAVLAMVGGWLNAIELARAVVLWVLLGVGITAFGWRVSTLEHKFGDRETVLYRSAPTALIVMLLVFILATEIPPTVFNHHDDLEKYFEHPVRMLATGTVYGGLLSAIGSETLGAQAFLQSFLLLVRPVEYLPMFDRVLCFCLLTGLLATSLRPRKGFIHIAIAVVPVLMAAAIEPQIVNVSAVFSGALILTALALAVQIKGPDGRVPPGAYAAAGMFVAIGFALKLTVGAPAAVALGLALMAIPVFSTWTHFSRSVLASVAGGLLGISGWLLTNLYSYQQLFSGRSVPGVSMAREPPPETLSLFSPEPLFYGGSFLSYSLLALMLAAACALIVIPAVAARQLTYSRLTVALIALVAAGWYFALVLAGPALAGYAQAVRYAIPTLIGVAPIVFALCANATGKTRLLLWSNRAVLGALCACTLVFLPSLWTRAEHALVMGNTIAFVKSPEGSAALADEDAYLLSPEYRQYVRGIQALVPPGLPILAWIIVPHHLQFERNPILTMAPAGLNTPWAFHPDAKYVLIQRGGFGWRSKEQLLSWTQWPGRNERQMAARTLGFYRLLEQSLPWAQVIESSGDLVLLHLPNGLPATQ